MPLPIKKYSVKNPRYATKEKSIRFMKLANKIELSEREEKILDKMYELHANLKDKFKDSISGDRLKKLLENRERSREKTDKMFDELDTKQEKEINDLITKISKVEKDRTVNQKLLKEINFAVSMYFNAPKEFKSKKYSVEFTKEKVKEYLPILKESKALYNEFYANVDKNFIEGNRLHNYLQLHEILIKLEIYKKKKIN